MYLYAQTLNKSGKKKERITAKGKKSGDKSEA